VPEDPEIKRATIKSESDANPEIKNYYSVIKLKSESQLILLRAIGISEMEKEIVRQVTSLEDKITVSEPEPEELSDEKVKVIIHEVLTELYYSKRK
jgi:hypothetical protein